MVHMAALNKVFFFICTHKLPAVPTLKTKKKPLLVFMSGDILQSTNLFLRQVFNQKLKILKFPPNSVKKLSKYLFLFL